MKAMILTTAMALPTNRVRVIVRVTVSAIAIFVAGVSSPLHAQSPRPKVDYGTENDYYFAITTGRQRVVEQYHLGPCENALNARKHYKAFYECNFILKIFPNHPQALHLAMRTCAQWKDPTCNVELLFEKAIAINPKASPTFVLHGIHLHGSKQYAKARQSYERALELDPDSLNAHYNLGLTCLELKDYACANEHAQRAYAMGSTLPGLRDRLRREGQWKPPTGQSALPSAPDRVSQQTEIR